MNQNKLQTLEFLKKFFLPLTNRVYIVGGYVRDSLLGIPSDDIDLEVYDIDIKTFTKLMDEIGAIGVGKSFFVYKYEGIDISLPRIEKKIGYGHKGFEVDVTNDEKIASKRRDFTINALMQNLYTDKILDFWGGIEDLKSKKIKVVNKFTFIEDSLRVLRAIRFAAKFGFKIEKQTLELICTISLDDLSLDRISKELELIFKAWYLEYAFIYLYKISFFQKYFKVNFTKKEIFMIYRLLSKKKKFFKEDFYEYYFLYIINSSKRLDFSILQSKKYQQFIYKHKALNLGITPKELCIIAIDMPISFWLGDLSDNIRQIAIKLDIYDTKLHTNITSKDVINDGFCNNEIAKELLRRKLKFIDDKILSQY